jgi:hypothetical protein
MAQVVTPARHVTPTPRRGWREPIESGIYRVHRVGCPSSADEKPGRRCGCPYSVRVPGGVGTSRTLKVPGTREDARRERAKRIGADRQVVIVPMGESIVHELALDYFAANAPSWQASTTELADGLYKSWVMPKWGETVASTITKADVITWMASGRALKAPRRADQALSLLRRILGHAADATPPRLAQNVAVGVKPPRAGQPKHATFTPAQAESLLAACSQPRDHVLVLLGLDGGLRIGEIRVCGGPTSTSRRAGSRSSGRSGQVRVASATSRRRSPTVAAASRSPPGSQSRSRACSQRTSSSAGETPRRGSSRVAVANHSRARAVIRRCSGSPIAPASRASMRRRSPGRTACGERARASRCIAARRCRSCLRSSGTRT